MPKGELRPFGAIKAELKRHPEGSRNKEMAKYRAGKFVKMLHAKMRGPVSNKPAEGPISGAVKAAKREEMPSRTAGFNMLRRRASTGAR